jgi:hypothetical protein
MNSSFCESIAIIQFSLNLEMTMRTLHFQMRCRSKAARMRGSATITKIWVKGLTEPLIPGRKPSMKTWKASLEPLRVHLETIQQIERADFHPGEQIHDPVTDSTSHELDSLQLDTFSWDFPNDDIIDRSAWEKVEDDDTFRF